MALLKLQDIGKIYVSDATVSVGIRNVNLEFDKGEFVAVTGKSGSGKTTLLNVISGMDSYEEGELFVEGEPTAHYTQQDWEAYRQRYISFIFQDYNIIESFTVQQNVELALMHLPNAKERRARALELIDRVGLTPSRHHKGSKLSGGQKQRTVIARALAKDSPIILADEPTGNLDSQSSREIIELLREISREKLVIVVTHSFDQVADYATREIRIFDGAVERDEPLRPVTSSKTTVPAADVPTKVRTLRQAFSLGTHRFFAMPKLSFFLCIVMLLAMMGSFFATATIFADLELGEPTYLFQNVAGRVVIVRHDGAPMTETELKALTQQTGAQSYLHYDRPLDRTYGLFYLEPSGYTVHTTNLRYDYGGSYTPDAGRLPQSDNEVFLHLPISWQPVYGTGTLQKDTVTLEGMPEIPVCGVSYFYDNTKEAKAVFTAEGYQRISRVMFFADAKNSGSFRLEMALTVPFADRENGSLVHSTDFHTTFWQLEVDPTLSENEFYFQSYDFSVLKGIVDLELHNNTAVRLDPPFATLMAVLSNYDHYGRKEDQTLTFPAQALRYDLCRDLSKTVIEMSGYTVVQPQESTLYVSRARMDQIMDCYYGSYTQASLFYSDDRAAEDAVPHLQALGYLGVPADATYTGAEDLLLGLITTVFSLLLWLGLLLLLGLVMVLCTSRAMQKTKGDLGILRSMGIPMQVIRLSTYVQMLYAMIPAVLLTATTATVLYLIPRTNEMLPFLHAFQYSMLLLGAVLISIFVARRHNRKMFEQSVRKTLKGGNTQ